jgi:hypothetical protein
MIPLKPKSVGIVVALVVGIVLIAVVVFGTGSSAPDRSTQNCPTGECIPGQPTVNFVVSVTADVYQGWFVALTPEILSISGAATTGAPAARFTPLDLFGTTGNLWITWTITYPSGHTFSWTSSKYTLTAGNGARSPSVTINGYYTGPRGAYVAVVTGYAQAVNCWPGPCSTQTITASQLFIL